MPAVVAVRFQHVPPLLRQHDGDVPMAIQALGSDEPCLAEMSQVAGARTARTLVVIAEVACRDHPKRPDGRERAAFRTPQSVLTVSGIVDDLSVGSARQVEIPHEHVAWVKSARIMVAFRPARIVQAIAGMLVGVGASRVAAWTAAKLASVIVPIAPSSLGLAPVVAVVPGSAAAASAMLVSAVTLAAGVVIARIKIEHAALRQIPLQCRYERRVDS